jgi:hypothetical protein
MSPPLSLSVSWHWLEPDERQCAEEKLKQPKWTTSMSCTWLPCACRKTPNLSFAIKECETGPYIAGAVVIVNFFFNDPVFDKVVKAFVDKAEIAEEG